MTQHLDDGLVVHKLGADSEKAFNGMAERLSLRPRDPFAGQPVSISPKEAEAVKAFQSAYEQDAREVYPGNRQMRSDAEAVRQALERDGKPKTRTVAGRTKGDAIEF